MLRRIWVVVALTGMLLAIGAPARGAECGHVVIFTTPGLTWADAERVDPPNMMSMVERGASGSVSVRTNSSRTTYASGFATLGAGARVDGGQTSIGIAGDEPGAGLLVPSLTEILDLARDAGYGAAPGALASSVPNDVIAIGNSDLGLEPESPVGLGRWAALVAMDRGGHVDRAWVGPQMLQAQENAPFGAVADPVVYTSALGEALDHECSVIVVDPGELSRADHLLSRSSSEAPGTQLDDAISRTDALLGDVMTLLDPEDDLLLLVSPTSPKWEDEPHLGVALALGPGFAPGSVLQSASTRRPGIVTLPDVAPTVLNHLAVTRPAEMNGRPWVSRNSPSMTIDDAVALDRETVLVDGLRGLISTWYVVFQVVAYLFGVLLLRTKGRLGGVLADILGAGALSIVAFPVATYAAGLSPWHDDGAVGLIGSILVVDAALVAAAFITMSGYLGRFLVLVAATTTLIVTDLLTGATLQLNTVLGYSPIVAGRFAGIGNIGFAVLGASALLTASILLHLRDGTGWMAGAIAILVVAVVADGAPQLGSDVGGVLALVPSFGIATLLLSGRRPSVKAVAIFGLGTLGVLGAFLAVDLARAPDSQTHLARTFQDVQARGADQLVEIITRKARANLRVFTSTIWTYFVPPALAAMAYLLSRPEGRWRDLADEYPRLRAGLVAGLVLAITGFALNDSGIVIPAVVLSFLVPLAVLIHLTLEAESPSAPTPSP